MDKYISKKENKNLSEKERQKHNKNFIQNKLKEYKNYFDDMFIMIDKNIKLDKEQRIAILNDEDSIILLAGAGSGKTTTITAKAKYLVEKNNIEPQEILIISFTNKAVEELKKRINIEFDLDIQIMTFHKLGYKIIKNKYKDIKIISDYNYILNEYLINKIKEKKELRKYYKKDKLLILITNYIKLLKINDYDYSDINEIIKLHKENKKIVIFLEFIKETYKYYQLQLKLNNYVDFEEMINKATKIVGKTNYKYIFIDEYQDISYQRFQLIHKIMKLSNSKLIAVGDDWQSIYSFSGSKLSLFIDLKKYINETVLLKITNTYRNSQELIDVAGNFVMKNKLQIKKRLKSNKSIKKPIEIFYYNNIINSKKNIIKIIKKISEKTDNIVILSRYKKDLETIKNIKINKKLMFFTVHSSKGLGFDNVIIINMSNEIYGFPSKTRNDETMNLILNSEDHLEEERRLFYVALTRTKNKVYILVPKFNPSIFIKELIKYEDVKVNKTNILTL